MSDDKPLIAALDAVIACEGKTEGDYYAVDGFHTSSVIVAKGKAPKPHEWTVIADCDPGFAKNPNWYADAQWFAASANLSRHAPALRALVEENERLRKEVERLRKPQFYWDVDNPECPWDNPFEYLDAMSAGEIKHFSTGNETGECFAVFLPAEEDAETDDEWTFSSASRAETAAALAAELKRREARAALEPRHEG